VTGAGVRRAPFVRAVGRVEIIGDGDTEGVIGHWRLVLC